MIRSKIFAALASAGLLASGLGAVASASPASASSCAITVEQNRPGPVSYTLTVLRNPCGFNINATFEVDPWNISGDARWYHGPVIRLGVSKAVSPYLVERILAYGYDYVDGGRTIYFQVGT